MRSDSGAALPDRVAHAHRGNELLVLDSVAAVGGGWLLPHRHGRLQGCVDGNMNGR
jgi:hypothetical protein